MVVLARQLGTVQLASVLSKHIKKRSSPKLLVITPTLFSHLKNYSARFFSPKMHDAVILIMCIPNSSKDHISLSPLPIFLHQGLIRGPCMGKGPTGKARLPRERWKEEGQKSTFLIDRGGQTFLPYFLKEVAGANTIHGRSQNR